MFTSDDAIGADATELFNYLTGCSRQMEYRKLSSLRLIMGRIHGLIDREIRHRQDGEPAHIVAKINRLADKQIIEKLYEASNAGVKIDLIVRGVCMLRPGVPGLSENITVRNIIGRFLEHSRVFYFANGGDDEVYIGSADWMSRNLNTDRSRGSGFRSSVKHYLKNVLLAAYLRDNRRHANYNRMGCTQRFIWSQVSNGSTASSFLSLKELPSLSAFGKGAVTVRHSGVSSHEAGLI